MEKGTGMTGAQKMLLKRSEQYRNQIIESSGEETYIKFFGDSYKRLERIL